MRIKKREKIIYLSKLFGKKCFYCEIPLEIETATLDHVLPKSKGGSSKLENLVIACFECNNKKNAKLWVQHPIESYKNWPKFYNDENHVSSMR